jgi:hypothetical protein
VGPRIDHLDLVGGDRRDKQTPPVGRQADVIGAHPRDLEAPQHPAGAQIERSDVAAVAVAA